MSFSSKKLRILVRLFQSKTDPDKIAAIKSWPKPQTTKEVRQFLRFTGYYRRFIKGYAKIARPLNDLLIGHVTKKTKSKLSKNKVLFKWEQ